MIPGVPPKALNLVWNQMHLHLHSARVRSRLRIGRIGFGPRFGHSRNPFRASHFVASGGS